MKASIKDFEIMAPVGSRESLAAAIQAGADSIYFGIESLNMRARSASTFTVNDLREIAQICDKHGIKSYLTINTIIYDEDIALMRTIPGEGGRHQCRDCCGCGGNGLLLRGGAGSTPFHPIKYQ